MRARSSIPARGASPAPPSAATYHLGDDHRTSTPDTAIEAFLDDRRDARLESYKELLRIPSISALPEHAADCQATAEWIAADLRGMGIEHVEVARDREATRSSTATGSTPMALRR